MLDLVTYTPIGVLSCENNKPYGAPRQGVLAKGNSGVITLNSPITPDCIVDLTGFEYIWLIYDFNQNDTWRAKVRPPRFSISKKSVLSTRSPYRPNSIGLSAVRLDRVEGLQLFVREHDLLNGTPILDIKPYLPYADSFPEVKTGWASDAKKHQVCFSEIALQKLEWLNAHLDLDVFIVIQSQLEFEPTCKKAKRVKVAHNGYVFSLQAWRLPFVIHDEIVTIQNLLSGYSSEDLLDVTTADFDKNLHLEFLHHFKN